MIFKTLLESTLSELYDSTVEAFPNTTKRQHATQPIKIINLRLTPFLGVRTLMARATAQNEGREYESMIVFKNVIYHDKNQKGLLGIESEGRDYFLEQLSTEETEVLVRCNCNDFYYRFNFYDYLDSSLFGRKRKKYESQGVLGAANPSEFPGLCKHLIKFAQIIQEQGLIK